MIKRKYLFVFIIISILTNWILTKHGDAEVGKQNSKSIFIKKGDGTIVDSISGLMWQEKDSGITMNLSEAEEYSSNLRLAEYADWRLPTKNELLELYKKLGKVTENVKDRRVLPFTWRGSRYQADGSYFIWGNAFDFKKGEKIINTTFDSRFDYVRAVRNVSLIDKTETGSKSIYVPVARIYEDTYSNQCVGLQFPLPDGWYVSTEAEKTELKEGVKIMGLDSPEAKAVLKQIPGMVLLMASQHSPEAELQEFNPNFIFMAINARKLGDQVATGADYLRFVSGSLREHRPDAHIADITSQKLGGQLFHRLDVCLPIDSFTACQRQLAKIVNDYIFVVNISAQSVAGLNQLSEIVGNLTLSLVSKEVDNGAECQAERNSATTETLNLSGNIGPDGIVLGMFHGVLAVPVLALTAVAHLFEDNEHKVTMTFSERMDQVFWRFRLGSSSYCIGVIIGVLLFFAFVSRMF